MMRARLAEPRRRVSVVLAFLAIVSGVPALAGHPAASATGGQGADGEIMFPTGAPVAAYCHVGEQGRAAWLIDQVQPGSLFSLVSSGSTRGDLDISFYAATPENCYDASLPHDNVGGDESGIVPATAAFAVVTLFTGSSARFHYAETALTDIGPSRHGSPTVVAVIEPLGFSPYHLDFLGARHPWNLDADTTNDLHFDADVDPATYISGYPGATPLALHLPATGDETVSALRSLDGAAWTSVQNSTQQQQVMYRFPGTKIVGALTFNGSLYNTAANEAHGTKSAASAVGNIHGSCPECLLVYVAGSAGLSWVAQQTWIDVVSASYGTSSNQTQVPTTEGPRDGIHFGTEPAATKQAVEAGQSIVWAAMNGVMNQWDAPQLTYTSSETGPDWIMTVGAVNSDGQSLLGSGKPADISGPGLAYASTGGATANGEGVHSGTSNATPVVAGVIASVIQAGRDLLQDDVGGHGGGNVASGTPQACRVSEAPCPLADGVLARQDVQDLIYGNVFPAPLHDPTLKPPTVPTTALASAYVGHGIIHGRSDVEGSSFELERRKFRDALRGEVAPPARPAGETVWMTTDSRCRQHLWGTWQAGYFSGTESAPDPATDPFPAAWEAWCTSPASRPAWEVLAMLSPRI
jgi:hypothetical protein